MTDFDAECVNPYGPESGWHEDGPDDIEPTMYAAVLVSARTGKELARTEPLCYAHAHYEKGWREAAGSIAKVRIDKLVPAEQ